MADQYPNLNVTTGPHLKTQKSNAQNADVRKMHSDIHTTKNSGSFVPPPMETITGKRMMQEASDHLHAQVDLQAKQPNQPTLKNNGFNAFVPPSMEAITGESVMPMEPLTMPLAPSPSDTPESVQNPYYAAGFLKNYIGREMRVQFLIGANGALMDRTGTLIEVGASFIVLRPAQTDDLLMCDLYSIKFVTIYR